jgi:hypothetical protein
MDAPHAVGIVLSDDNPALQRANVAAGKPRIGRSSRLRSTSSTATTAASS